MKDWNGREKKSSAKIPTDFYWDGRLGEYRFSPSCGSCRPPELFRTSSLRAPILPFTAIICDHSEAADKDRQLVSFAHWPFGVRWPPLLGMPDLPGSLGSLCALVKKWGGHRMDREPSGSEKTCGSRVSSLNIREKEPYGNLIGSLLLPRRPQSRSAVLVFISSSFPHFFLLDIFKCVSVPRVFFLILVIFFCFLSSFSLVYFSWASNMSQFFVFPSSFPLFLLHIFPV